MDPPPPPPSMADLIYTMNEILQNQQAFRTDLITVSTVLNQLRIRIGPPGFTGYPPDLRTVKFFPNTFIKLDIPMFDGKEPLS